MEHEEIPADWRNKFEIAYQNSENIISSSDCGERNWESCGVFNECPVEDLNDVLWTNDTGPHKFYFRVDGQVKNLL